MKRNQALRVAVSILLVLALAEGALAKAYVSSRGYEITPAPGWQVNSQGYMGADVVLYTKPADGFAANLNVIIRPLPKGMDMKHLQAENNAEIKGVTNGYSQISQGFTKVAGAPALSTIGEHKMGTPPRTLYMHQISAVKNGMIYTFTCTALASNHAKYDAAFDRMLKSIRWQAGSSGK